MTTLISTAARITILLGALLLGACQGPVQVVDQLPSFVEREQLRSTVWLGLTKNRRDISSMASAIIISRNVLLTNAHVWAAKEPDTPWWEAELPAERTVFLSQPKLVVTNRSGAKGNQGRLLKPLTPRKFRLLASGMEGMTRPANPPDSENGPRNLWSRDWVLIETERPNWRPEDAAIFYPKSLDPTWTPRPRTDVLIAGYSSLFLGDDSETTEEEAKTSMLNLALFLMSGPYVLRGDVRMIEDQPGVTYQAGWPRPGGHSGGGVYVLNADTQRPELIGVFHSHVPVRVALSLFGMRLGSTRRWYLCYAPAGRFVEALRKHGLLRPSTMSGGFPRRTDKEAGVGAAPAL